MEPKKISIANPPNPTFYVKEIFTDGIKNPDMAYGDEIGGCSYFTRVTIIKSSVSDPKDLEQLQEQLKTTLSKEQG